MIRTLALLCLAVPAFGFLGLFPEWKPNLRVTFGINPFSSFTELPKSIDEAKTQNFVQVPTRPKSPAGFSSLRLFCPKNDYSVCVLFDDTGYVAGLQYAVNINQVTNNLYDWETQGCTYWSVEIDGQIENFWTIHIFFSSPEFLATNADARISARDSTKLLQDKYIYVIGINGKLHAIPNNLADVANTEVSHFTKQGCMLGMGNHYYYNMTEQLECNDQLFKFFILGYANRVVGIGAVLFYGVLKNHSRFEVPNRQAVKMIVPRGPTCLYDLADSPGLNTMHAYFIDKPSDLTCVGESLLS